MMRRIFYKDGRFGKYSEQDLKTFLTEDDTGKIIQAIVDDLNMKADSFKLIRGKKAEDNTIKKMKLESKKHLVRKDLRSRVLDEAHYNSHFYYVDVKIKAVEDSFIVKVIPLSKDEIEAKEYSRDLNNMFEAGPVD